MKHIHTLSQLPKPAQSAALCSNIESDFQAELCFIVEILISFALPLLSSKIDATES